MDELEDTKEEPGEMADKQEYDKEEPGEPVDAEEDSIKSKPRKRQPVQRRMY